MTDSAAVIEKLRAWIGVESEPFVLEVEKGDILRFTHAIGEDSPLFSDEVRARERRYGGIIAPPTYLMVMATIRPASTVKLSRELGAELYPHSLQGANGWTYYEPVRPGDRLTARMKLVDVYERRGSLGPMMLQLYETTFVDQFGELVAMQRDTVIRYRSASQ